MICWATTICGRDLPLAALVGKRDPTGQDPDFARGNIDTGIIEREQGK